LVDRTQPVLARDLLAISAFALLLPAVASGARVDPSLSESDYPDFSGDLNILSRTLRQMADRYQPGGLPEFLLGGDLDYQSHRASLEVPLEMRVKLLDAILEADPDIVRVTPSYEPWLFPEWNASDELRGYMDRIVELTRGAGKGLMIADGAAEYYWENRLDWESFSDAFVSRVTDLATRYEPEYYVVVKEPAWYNGLSWSEPGGMLLSSPTVSDWLELTDRACSAVKRASQGTVTMVAVIPGDASGGDHFPESREYFIAAHGIESVDVVGVDVYSVADLLRVEGMLDSLTGEGKPHWILETWEGHPDTQDEGWRVWSHADWLALVSRYAQNLAFEGVVTFYNRCLCYAGSERPGSFQEWDEWLENRTPAFEVLEVIAELTSEVSEGWLLPTLAFSAVSLLFLKSRFARDNYHDREP